MSVYGGVEPCWRGARSLGALSTEGLVAVTCLSIEGSRFEGLVALELRRGSVYVGEAEICHEHKCVVSHIRLSQSHI